MFRFKLIAGLVSLVALAGLVLIVVASAPAPVEAGGEISSDFDLVENLPFTPVGTGASGEGKFELHGEDLDDLAFELEIEAEGLMPNTEYYLTVTVRNGFAGLSFPVATVPVGLATTDDEGKLEFEGEDVLPASAFTTGTEWRIDQQIRLAGGGGGTTDFCFECILVCSPTTKVVHAGLVPFDG